MNTNENELVASHELDRRIAELLGWRYADGLLYSPDGEIYGGDHIVHSGARQSTPEVEDAVWRGLCPRFTTHIESAIWLLDSTKTRWGLRGLNNGQYACWIGGGNDTHAATPALAACGSWLMFMEFNDRMARAMR